jgi:glycosyltransferase involved in cell wall biosynthesis
VKISVVIPAYNAQDTIACLLEALLNQQRLPDEVIIVDNNSQDDTKETVQRFIANRQSSVNIILEREAAQGPSSARNKGARDAGGDVIAFIDADEEPSVAWLMTVEEEFSRGTDVLTGTVFEQNTETFLRSYLDVMERATVGKREVFAADIYSHKFLYAGNCAIRKDLFIRLGMFDPGMQRGEDHDLSKRIYAAGTAIVYNPRMEVIHNHRETLRGRAIKAFHYGILQARFLQHYLGTGFTLVLSGAKHLHLAFPLKVTFYAPSVLNALLLAMLISFYNPYVALTLIAVVLIGIQVRTFALIARSGRKIGFLQSLLFGCYWGIERLLFDLGRVGGSLRYRVVCF